MFHLTSEQPLRFHRFMYKLLDHLEGYRRQDRTSAGIFSFMGKAAFNLVEAFLMQSYENFCGSLAGLCPMSMSSIASSLLLLTKFLHTAQVSACNRKAYGTLVRNIQREIPGLSDSTKAQHLVLNCSSLGLFIPLQFLQYYNSGSPKQLKLLRLEPFLFQGVGQVDQLQRNLLSKQSELLPMHADALITAVLDDTASQTIFRNHSPYFHTKDPSTGDITTKRFNADTRRLELVANTSRFNYSKDDQSNHYVPDWCTEYPEMSNHILLISKAGLQEGIPSLGKKKQSLASEVATEISDRQTDVSLQSQIPRLLSARLYVVLENPKSKVCEFLGVSETNLMQAITISCGGPHEGFIPTLDIPCLETQENWLPEQDFFHQLSTTRTPPHKLIHHHPHPAAYKSKHWAELAMFLHLLFNYSPTGNKKHWTVEHFRHSCTGFLLLVPFTASCSVCTPAVFVFLNPRNNNMICASFINKIGVAHRQFVVGYVLVSNNEQPA